MRRAAIFLAVTLVSACVGNPKMVKKPDGSEVTEGIALAEVMLEKHTTMCWQFHLDNERRKEDARNRPVATVAPPPVVNASALTASGQVEYFQSQQIRLLSEQMNRNSILMNQLVSLIVEALRPRQSPCDELEGVMVAYYNQMGKKAVAQSAVYQRGLGVIGIVGGIWATGEALKGIAEAGGDHYTFGDIETNVATPKTIQAPGAIEGEIPTTAIPPGFYPGDSININYGGSQQSLTGFGPANIGQAEKQLFGGGTFDDSGDGSGNEAGFLQ